MLGTTDATRSGDAEVRGEACMRYAVEVAPGQAAGLEGIQLVDLPKPDDYWRVLHADVCIDRSGLVRRIAWSPRYEPRLKPGLLPRVVARLAKEPPPAHDSEGRLWNVLEFWDYGCEVDITAPTNLIDTSDSSLRKIVRDLWRMKREYQKRTRQRT
jgi:hypothetical protein